MSKIDTLIEDIYSVFDKGAEVPPEDIKSFGESLANIMRDRVTERKGNHLRLSNLGSPCRRKLWYSINTPELGESLPGYVRIKFLIGDITEAVVLFLAKCAGHTVENEQQTVEINGVVGHIDADIDGELVDVKSASPYSFSKFREGLRRDQDAFGYLGQLGGYAASKGQSRGHFLAVDKVLGHLTLDTHTLDKPLSEYEKDVDDVREILANNVPPERGYTDEEDGKSGNRKLGVACSYCDFKYACWPGIQSFAYSNGPRYLTKVVREPRVDKG